MPYIYADPLRCTGCEVCALVCSFRYFKVLNPKKARIRVVRKEPAIDLVIACRNCDDAPCINSCPRGAIKKTSKGIIVIDEKKCDGCGKCVEACPLDALYIPPGEKTPIKCIVCGACIEMCPVNCLKIAYGSEEALAKRVDYARRIMEKILMSRGYKAS